MGKAGSSTRKNNFASTKRHVTSYDVARHAGVSQSAVSRCFKPGASVSKKMRDRVMTAVRELGYTPNAIARGLITRRSNMVAVIVSNLNFYPEVVSELSARFTERGVHVLLFSLNHESDVSRTLEQVWQYQVDGVLAAAHLSREEIGAFVERKIPLVFYNRSYEDVQVSSVSCDQVEGERALINRLAASGLHESYGIIAGPADSVVSMQRTRGALERLKEFDVRDITQVSGDYGYKSGRRAVQEIVAKRGAPPDAIVCANDMMAFGAMDELRYHLDFDVPGDVSVVGFDGVRVASWSSFDLATVVQPVESMAEAAVSMLLDRADNYQMPPEKRLFAGVLRDGSTIRG